MSTTPNEPTQPTPSAEPVAATDVGGVAPSPADGAGPANSRPAESNRASAVHAMIGVWSLRFMRTVLL